MTYAHEEIKIENQAVIYADGACWQESGSGVGGWGVVIEEGDKITEIYGGDGSTTNNKMEMTAAIKALEALKEASIVKLYTDSKYLINGITIWIRGWKKNGWITQNGEAVKNKELWQQLDDLCKKHRVNWEWVRGHSGNPGNDRADALAVKGKEEEKEKIRKSLSTPKFPDFVKDESEEKFNCPCVPAWVGVDLAKGVVNE